MLAKRIHLFYISNYISFNNYLSIIIKNNISIEDCFFYSPRLTINELNINFKINLIDVINIKEPQNIKEKIFHFIKKSQHKKQINKVISKKKFYFYTPHLINNREKIIVTSKLCVKYFFVEEGIPAYNHNYKINYCKKFSEIKEISNYKNKLDSVYCNHEKSFDFKINKNKIPLSFTNKYKKKAYHSIKNNDIVIAIDSNFSDVKFINIIISYMKLLSHLKFRNHHQIKLKFHPDYIHQPSCVKVFEEINQSIGIDFEILKNNVCLEEIASLGVKINVYCIFSSLYIYMSQYNSKVYIYDDYLRHNDEAYFDIYSFNKKIIDTLKLNIEFVKF